MDYCVFIKLVMECIFVEVCKMGVLMIMYGVGVVYLVNEWYDLLFDVVGLDWCLLIEEVCVWGVYKVV